MRKKKLSITLLIATVAMFVGLFLFKNLNMETLRAEETKSTETSKSQKETKEVKASTRSTVVNGVKVPLDAYTTRFKTIEDLPFEALNEEGDLDGFDRLYVNEPREFETKLNDGRRYYNVSGVVNSERAITNVKGSIYDHLWISLPRENYETKYLKTFYEHDVNNDRWTVPLLGTQVAVTPNPDLVPGTPNWVSYYYWWGSEAGSYTSTFVLTRKSARNGTYHGFTENPQLVKLYFDGTVTYSYGISMDSKGKIDGYFRVKTVPVGEKGRVNTTIKYINATSKADDLGMAYGIHVDVQGAHKETGLYSLGEGKGVYFYEEELNADPRRGGDGQPYLLKFHTDGYENQPDTQFVNNDAMASVWIKVGRSHTGPGEPAVDPGKNKAFDLGDERHPAVGYRWGTKNVEPGGSLEWSLEQSVTSADALKPSMEKTAKNTTTTDIKETYPDNLVEYTVALDVPSKITDGKFVDSLPKEVSAPTEIYLDRITEDGQKETEKLDVSTDYDEIEHKIKVNLLEIDEGEAVLRYTVKVLGTAAQKTISNKVVFNGTDVDADPVAELEESFDIDVKNPPIGFVTVKYHNQKGDKIADSKEIEDIIGTALDEKPIAIPGYKYDRTDGPANGSISAEKQTIIFYYDEARFNLKQEVFDADKETADNEVVSNRDDLTYKVTLDSLYDKAVSDGINYQDFTIVETVGKHLEKIDNLTFKTKSGTVINSVAYDKGTGLITATIAESDEINRSEGFVLEYTATVTDEATEGEKIEASATAEGTYTDEEKATKKESNTVVSTLKGDIWLESAPAIVDFGELNIMNYKQKVSASSDELTEPLLVQDTRVTRQVWSITAQIETFMHNGSDIREEALKYVYQNDEKTLTTTPQQIYAHTGSDEEFKYDISKTWQEGDMTDGLKFKLDSNRAPIVSNEYTGTIKWVLRNTIDD